MNSNFKKLNKHQIKAVIELNQQDLQNHITKAENMLGKDLEVKGFRKGKIPKEMFKKHLDPEKVRALALEAAIEESLADFIRQNSFDVLDTSQLAIEKNDAVQLKFSVLLELFPEVELADLGKIKVKKQDVKVEEKEIEGAIEIIKNSRSSFINKNDDETANDGDRVEIDFEVKKDGQIIEGGKSKNHPLIIGGRGFIPGFEEQLVGMKKEETKNFSLTAPADYFYKEIAGKKLDFSVKLNEIKRVIRPEINDDFAKSLGHFANVLELKENIKIGLAQEKNTKERQKLRLQILDNIISQSKIEVPDNLLSKQLDVMISDFDHTLHDKGMELGLYLAKIGKTQEELKKDWIKEAEKQAKISIVLRKIAKDRRLNATQEEVEEMANQVIQAAIMRGEVGQNDVDPVQIKENVTSRIINEKTLNYIESQCAV